jgi:hypothetical protein
VFLTPLSLSWPWLSFTHLSLLSTRLIQWLLVHWFPSNFSLNESALIALFATRLFVLPTTTPAPNATDTFCYNLAMATMYIFLLNYGIFHLVPRGSIRLRSALFWLNGLLIGFVVYYQPITVYFLGRLALHVRVVVYWLLCLSIVIPASTLIQRSDKMRRLDFNRKVGSLFK